jgi:hypothetical protein
MSHFYSQKVSHLSHLAQLSQLSIKNLLFYYDEQSVGYAPLNTCSLQYAVHRGGAGGGGGPRPHRP